MYKAAIFFLITIAISAKLARSYGWYSNYWYTDILMHILAGVMFGLFWLGLTRTKSYNNRLSLYGSIVMAAVFGSFVWEIWELYGNKFFPTFTVHYIGTLSDALSDIACGLFGGILLAIAHSIKNIRKFL